MTRWSIGFGAAIGGATLILIATTAVGRLDPLRAAALLVCGTATVIAAVFALDALRKGQGIAFDSYWGGLGGGLGGWRVSPVTTTVLLALIFFAGTLALGTNSPDDKEIGNVSHAALKKDPTPNDQANGAAADETDAASNRIASANGSSAGNESTPAK